MLDGLFERARAERSGTLVVHGEPGVGKTALLEYAIDSASDLRIVRAVGVESETELPFAALHQLCAPMLDRLDRLPGPQRDALAITFGLSAGVVPDRLLVGAAVLNLLSEVADERPLLCVVDDAQWLDRASAQALGFVARRLRVESVLMLFAGREPGQELQGLPQLEVEGLGPGDARKLSSSVIPWPLDERVRDQIVAETRGNPAALLELQPALAPARLAGGFGFPGALSPPGRIEENIFQRLEALPQDTRRLLLLAAAEPTGDPALLRRAVTRLGLAYEALAPAQRAGLLRMAVTVRFSHPFVRSAVYRAASAEERRMVHRALAEATDGEVDSDRRAWHLAQATVGPHEDVAAQLERAAGGAQARGGLAAAAAFLERATALTVDPSRRAERALAAAQAKCEAGSFDDALGLLATAEAYAVDDLERAQVHRLRGRIAFASRHGSDAPSLLLKAAQELELLDAELARTTYLEALSAALLTARPARGVGVVEVSRAALAGPPSPEPPRPSDLLLQGLAVRFTQGYAAAAPILKAALKAFRLQTDPPPQEARWLGLASWVASHLWDDDTWALLSTRQLERARASGTPTAIAFAVSARSPILALSGELAAVASMVDETRAVTEATGIATPPCGALWLAALRGREPDASALIETTGSEAVPRGEGSAPAITELATATLNNGLGRYDAALAAVRRAGERSDDAGSTRAVPELIEAAARCREPELAERALQRLAETTRASGSEWALGIEARSRALLSDGQAAESLYREAIERLQRTRVRVELARAHLLYGEWLRRESRRVAAREALRVAFELFTAMGVDAFAERAERELLATGERVRRRTVEAREYLTSQEAQIARLARDGLSNPEIGSRLFISPRTVEYHLHKVFNKLDISSRNQLDRVLPPELSAAVAV